MIAGKSYVHRHIATRVFECLFVTDRLAIIRWDSKQEACLEKSMWPHYEEYTPPVVHKLYVQVYKTTTGSIHFSPPKYTAIPEMHDGWKFLTTIPIEYTEAP